MKKPSKNSNLKKGKILLFSLMLILVSFSFIGKAYFEKPQDVDLTYYFNSPDVSTVRIDNVYYDMVNLPNCYTAGNPGEPDIPSYGAYILLPPESKVDDIRVDVDNKIDLGYGFNIKPLGEVLPISQWYRDTELKADNSIYEKNDFYPGSLYSYVGVYSFRGYDILVLLLHPMQYNPVTGELFYYGKIKISVDSREDNIVRGTPIWLLLFAKLLDTLNRSEKMVASISFVDVLPLLPVIEITFALSLFLQMLASSP